MTTKDEHTLCTQHGYRNADCNEPLTIGNLQEPRFHRDCPESSKLDVKTYTKQFHDNGIAGLKKQLRNDLESWRTIELNAAVIGNSGTGKSSFINAIRGLSAEHPLAATVGCTEETTTREAYQHPSNSSFPLWDLPGAGTDKFPQKIYLETIEFTKYDCFILMTKSRLTETDSWLAVEIQNLNKKCFVVRSNIDIEIENDSHDHSATHEEETLLENIRMESENILRNNGVKVPQVFLISNRATDKYDFKRLNDALLSSCDGLKKDAMALSLTTISRNVIIEKKNSLTRRIPAVALSVVSSDSDFEQKRKFQDEIEFYLKQFSIDDVSLAEGRDILGLSDERIEEHRVVFDETPMGKETEVTTPTAKRETVDTWERFVDWFRLSKRKKIVYKYCKFALKENLGILFEKACIFYDISTATEMVRNVLK